MTYERFQLRALAFAGGIMFCAAAPTSPALAGETCNFDADCDDDNACTIDVCDKGICGHSFNAAPCDDGCICTTDDTCDGGTCSGTPDPGCDKCVDDSECEDGDPCTKNKCRFDECPLGGVCAITPACDDDNPCTDDSCSPTGQCFNVANYDPATTCCNPTNGTLSAIACDQTHCYDPVCLPMGCTCCDRPSGDPCAGASVPAASRWCVVVVSLLAVILGSLAISHLRGSTQPEGQVRVRHVKVRRRRR